LFHPSLNVVWDLAPHDISILLYLLESLPYSIATNGMACVQPGVEDVAYLSLMFPNDVLSHIRVSWLDPSKTRRFTVVGSKKMAIYDDTESHEKIRIFDRGVEANRRTDTYGEFQFDYRYGDIVSPFIHFEEPLRLECLHFIECVTEGKTPSTDGYSGLRVVEIIEAAQRSLRKGGAAEPAAFGVPGEEAQQTAVHMLEESA
jgi:predicted dehydrogenase